MTTVQLHCIFDYLNCISNCFHLNSSYYGYTSCCFNYYSDCFSCTSIWYNYNFDYTASMTSSTAFFDCLWHTSIYYDYNMACFYYISNYSNYFYDTSTIFLTAWATLPTTISLISNSLPIFTYIHQVLHLFLHKLSAQASRLHSLYLVVLNSKLAYYHLPKS
jgi:hypothetical protein